MFVFLCQRDGESTAAAVFTAPVNRYFGKGSVELARLVRTPEEPVPMTWFLSRCVRELKKDPRRLRFLIAYADTTVGHHGGVYQAANFMFVARSKGNVQYRHRETGRIVSGRSFDQHADGNKDGYDRLRTGPKNLYVMPLHEKKKELLRRFGWRELHYPKPEMDTQNDG